ncbi:MAG: NUDIX hydrolase [Nitrospirae bacterium]|nr:NUDIX hydrolase [Nitrospirota bacterium]
MCEIIEKKVLWEGKFLRFLQVGYRDSSGSIRNWETFERVNCNGVVAIVPVTDKGEVLIIRQYRPAVDGYVIEFPAGLNDKGESLEDAARRELIEETGYSAKELIFLAEGPISSGASGEILTAYLAKGLEFKGIDQRDETEDIEVFHIPINELADKLSSLRAGGNYIDLKVMGLMEMAKKYL